MVYARIEAFPNKTSADFSRYGGALVNCWIESESTEEAISVARRMIAERGWHSEALEEVRLCERSEFEGSSLEYFDQALIDHEVLVFHVWSKNESERKA